MSTPISAGRPTRQFLVDRMRAIDRAVTRRVGSALPPDIAAQVSVAHMRLMAEVPPEGIRPSHLAARLGVSRSAVSQLIHQLEARDLLERGRDETDRRAELVRQTKRAGRGQASARRAIVAIEASWTVRLGADRMALLEEILNDLEDWTRGS